MAQQEEILETQRFPRPWSYVLLMPCVALPFIFWYPKSNDILQGPFFTLLIFLILWSLLHFSKIRLTINEGGITFRSTPTGMVNCEVDSKDIAAIEIKPLNALKDFGGWGWRLNSANISGYIFAGNTGILITKRSGDKVMISTRLSPNEVSLAIERSGLLPSSAPLS